MQSSALSQCYSTLKTAIHAHRKLHTDDRPQTVHNFKCRAFAHGSCNKSRLWTQVITPGADTLLTSDRSVSGIGLLSKVSQGVQHLDLSHDDEQDASDQLSTSPNSVLDPGTASSPTLASERPAQQGSIQAQTSQQPGVPDSSEDWQRASSSHNAARKKKRKQQRRAASHTEPVSAPPSVNGSAQAGLPPSTTSAQADQVVYAARSGDVVVSNAEDQTAASSLSQGAAPSVMVAASNPAATLQHDEPATSALGHETADSEAGSAETADDVESDTSISLSQPAESAARDSEADEQSLDEEELTDEAACQSSVASVTADFAMQNVILQMGLRLVAPNGMRIKQLSRWVLRCSACFKITKVSSSCTCCPLLVLLTPATQCAASGSAHSAVINILSIVTHRA